MCLAIPAKICELQQNGLARVDILGVSREVALDLTPSATVGDYVLVHAGFAIEVVDEQFAQETLDLVRQFPYLVADDFPSVEQVLSEETTEETLFEAEAAPLSRVSAPSEEEALA